MNRQEEIGATTAMTPPSTATPPRLVPDRPFPPYAYIPGRRPHPTRDTEGHSYGVAAEIPEPPDPAAWRACRDYLYGIDLFNHGFYWEAHEAWEGLWVACGRRGPTATFLQGLINLAAAGFKARWGNPRGLRANAKTAAALLDTAARRLGPEAARFMGLDVRALAAIAGEFSKVQRSGPEVESKDKPPAFDLLLRPE